MKRSSERSKPLHNFTLPPHLKWGHQKFLTCIKVDPHTQSPLQSKPEINLPNSSAEQLEEEEAKSDANAARPWNLRTRRAAAYKGATNGKLAESPPLRRTESVRVLLKGNNGNNCDYNRLVGQEKARLSVPLMKEEIEEDFAVMAGIRPPRRPKKRPRVVQKQLDSLFPGLWLSEVTLDSYKVPEMPES